MGTGGRPYLHVDWPDAIRRCAEAQGEWVLIANDVSANTISTVNHRENRALREAGKMEARMLEVYGDPPRGDLWMRAVTDYKPPRVVGDAVVKQLRMPVTLKRQVRRFAQQQGVSVSSMADRALLRIAKRGRRNEDPEATVIAVNVGTKRWERAARRAEEDGFILSVALREEMLYESRRRR
jgi:hypothetical protein